MGERDLHQSKASLLPRLPVQKTALTLLGVIIYLYLAGISKARMGMWKSPRTRASWPIYSYSDMLIGLYLIYKLSDGSDKKYRRTGVREGCLR